MLFQPAGERYRASPPAPPAASAGSPTGPVPTVPRQSSTRLSAHDHPEGYTGRSRHAGVTVNLATGTAQGGNAEGDTLTGIENVYGSNHADHLTGDDGRNRFYGLDGDDTLEGGAGNDNLQGDGGNDNLQGGDGNDYLHGGAWADRLDGGEGDDTAAYSGSDAGVTVNLTSGRLQRGGHAEGDRLTGIENIDGSSHADHLIGNGRNNRLHAEDGNDTLEGGAGADRLKGGDGGDHLVGDAGADTLDGGEGWDVTGYWGSDAGVTVNLATGTGQGGHAEGDTLAGIRKCLGVALPCRPSHR